MTAKIESHTSGVAVYRAIAAVQGELAKTGIAKDGVNSAQNYKFRGIDQVYGALSPLLAKHGLCILPRIIKRDMHERVTVKEWNGQRKESVVFYVTVTAQFDFVSTEDGSCHTVQTYGEAMDSGDKSTNKAMSAAYKYAAFMAFAIPTEGDNDADATTHEVVTRIHQKTSEPINQTQCDTLRTLIEASGSNIVAFCKYYEIESLPELPANKFAHAEKSLQAKLAAKGDAA
jgi:hypothetical protein